MIAGLPDPFASVEFADSVCTSDAWAEATEQEKESALQWARVYIEKHYTCYFDLGNAPNTIKVGNSLLAEKHLAAPIFETEKSATPERGMVAKVVDADGIRSEKRWDANVSKAWVDPFPEITAILALGNFAVLKTGKSIRRVPLIRG